MSGGGEGTARLDAVRDHIEAIDRGIIAALAERVRLAHEAATAKRAAGQPTLDPPREAAVVRRAADEARALGLPDEPVREIFWQVIALCRSEQLDRG